MPQSSRATCYAILTMWPSSSKYGILTDTYRTPRTTDDVQEAPYAPTEIDIKTYDPRTPSDHFPVKVSVTIAD